MNAVMTVLDAVGKQGEVTRIASEGQIALQAGDTPRARLLFQQAAEMMESAIGDLKKPSERDLARFLVATHYYLGGHFAQAAKVCERIQGKRLPSRVRHIYPPFLKNVRERSAPDYISRYTGRLDGYYQRARNGGDPSAAQEVIEILMEHSYLLPHDQMAYMRAMCAEVLGRQRAASLFYRNAWRFNPENPNYLLFCLRSLCKEGRYAEAWALVDEALVNHPGVRSSIYAIFVRHRQIGAVPDLQDRQPLMQDITKHLELAWESYRSLPTQEQTGLTLQMDWAFTMAWNAHMGLTEAVEQRKMLDRWIERRPDSPYPRILRGATTYPGENAKEDFREAIRLKSTEPWPYYFLAQEAFRSLSFQECDRLCSLALQRNPPPDIRAALLSWQAISRWNLGLAKPQEIRKLFNEAKQLKPDDPLIASYAQGFEDDERKPRFPTEIGLEGEERTREQAKRYVDEVSKRDIEDMSPTLNLIAV
jgi:tetratricopeptide (TPR) repeat protein